MEFFFWSMAATLNALMAVFAFCMLVSGESAYRYVGFGNWLDKRSDRGLWLPSALMIAGIALFGVIVAYCLSALGVFHLPNTLQVIGIVTIIYILRGIVVLFDPMINPPLPAAAIFASIAALLTGAIQALGIFFM